MDFFQAQESARRRSGLLVFYFVCAVVFIVVAIYAVALFASGRLGEAGPETSASLWQPDVFAFSTLGTLLIVAGGSVFKTLSLRSGGSAVAKSLGGRLVSPQTTDPADRRLLNIVEEMAIASGVRVPAVFVLPESGINAFAAGYSPDDAAVGVTEGALATLTRDELQGVIAHEFSHILNGDMRLNIRLIGLLFGILLLAVIGRGVLHTIRLGRVSSSRRGGKNGGGAVAILAIGLALIVIGYVGVLFGRLIQAAVSRQREFLADAAAVQFTRNPDGIAGALAKIGGLAAGSRVENTHATETSHLFFANALRGSAMNLFATHPPLEKRIRAIKPDFDGRFPRIEAAPPRTAPAAAASRASGAPPLPVGHLAPLAASGDRPESAPRPATPPPLRPEQFVERIADPIARLGSDLGSRTLAAIPESLREAARDPRAARAILVGLLLDPGETAVEIDQKHAAQGLLSPTERTHLATLLPDLRRLPAGARLTLVDLALPTVASLPTSDVATLLQTLRALAAADGRTTLFEFALLQVASRRLGPRTPAAGPGSHIVSFQALVEELSLVVSLVALAGSNDPASVRRAFDAGAAQLGLVRDRLVLSGSSAVAPERLERALSRLERAAPPIKQRLVAAVAHAAAADGVVMPREAEVLRAVAAAIGCPAPPLDA
jgi:Zn-dependent protease with chaperone function